LRHRAVSRAATTSEVARRSSGGIVVTRLVIL
jgi:hypothetical protein